MKVAVLDSGADPTHIDQFDKIDLLQSANFITAGTSNCGPADEGLAVITGNPLADRIADLNGHGTIVTSNNFGTAGVAPLSQVVAVKVLSCGTPGGFPAGLVSDVIGGLLYAPSLPDVQVVSMSLGNAFDRSRLHQLSAIDPSFQASVVVGLLNKAVNLRTPMQRLQIQLIVALDRHEAHRGPAHALGDRFRIDEVVLVRLTYGFTYCAGISRTSCPCRSSARPNKCQPPQASLPIR